MKINEFDYQLPEKLIATEPVRPRSAARLLVLNLTSGVITDSCFSEINQYLREGDVLVFNNSKVIPARLKGVCREREFEILLVKQSEEAIWECWLKPGRRAKAGDVFQINEKLSGELLRREDDIFFIQFNLTGEDFFREIKEVGEVPLPPYILKERKKRHQNIVQNSDEREYQTIYAKLPGSVAAPTAGLHFDEVILERLNKSGVQTEEVTLHVGLGTFEPVKTERIEDFKIHAEYFSVSAKTAENLNQAKAEGRRIIAVGTTAVRVLESSAKDGRLQPGTGETNIYIYPGYEFQFVDGIITNFHLPKSSLLLLVSAFAGKEQIDKAYRHAVENEYRFYSYGDGMLIL